MRLKLTIQLKNKVIPLDYRRLFVSFFKHCLLNSDSDYYKSIYGLGNPSQKNFTFAIYFFPPTKITKENVFVDSCKLNLTFSSDDDLQTLQFYNAFMGQKNRWHDLSSNSFKLVNIVAEKEKCILGNKVIFKMMSPMVIRDHNKEEQKDWFFTLDENGAIDILKRNLKSDLKDVFEHNASHDVDSLKITPIKLKKVVVRSYEFLIPCTLGTFEIEGPQYLLQCLYKRGIGSKRSLGFSTVDIV